MNADSERGRAGGGKRKLVVLADEDLRRSFEKLEADNRILHKSLLRAIEALRQDPFCGVQIRKRLIPKAYVAKHGADNLRKYDLSNGWRLVYFIKGNQAETAAVILEWLPHKKYERRFGY